LGFVRAQPRCGLLTGQQRVVQFSQEGGAVNFLATVAITTSALEEAGNAVPSVGMMIEVVVSQRGSSKADGPLPVPLEFPISISVHWLVTSQVSVNRANQPGCCARKQHGSLSATPDGFLAWWLLIKGKVEKTVPDGTDLGRVEAPLAEQLDVG